MNVIVLMGRLTADPEFKYAQGNATAVARYTLAVDRMYKKEGGDNTDFIRCVAFGARAEFAQKYLRKGMKISIRGHLQTGSYKNRDGIRVYTTDVVVDEHDFCESKQSNANSYNNGQAGYQNQTYQNQTYQNQGQSGSYNTGAPQHNQRSVPDNPPVSKSSETYQNQGQGNSYNTGAPQYNQRSVPDNPSVSKSSEAYAANGVSMSAAPTPGYGGPAGAGYSSPNGGYQIPNGTNTTKPTFTQDPNYAEGFMNIPDGIDEELPFN